MTTALYPTFQKRVNDAVEQLIVQQVTPWSFLTTGRPFCIKRFDGRQIAYNGVEFVGSPSAVFWSGYIEPFVEDLVMSEIAEAASMAKEKGVDGRLLLEELQTLLSAGYHKVYARMSDVDQRLTENGRGTVNATSIHGKIQAMDQFLDEHIRGELEMWKPISSVEIWYQGNKFWVWAIGISVATVISIAGLLV